MEGCPVLKIYILIATLGRPALVRRTIDLLAHQTRPADEIVVASVDTADVEGVEHSPARPRVLFSEKGSCRQRNHALDWIGDNADVVVFFDDDFIPAPDYLEKVESLFLAQPELVGITGWLLDDGVRHGGFTIEQAQDLIAARPLAAAPMIEERHELYGCNMAVRMSAANDLRFDEQLPLYGWQEDIDYTNRLGRRGRQIATTAVTGVHLGVSGGRTSGRKLGYSQVANVIYLKRKGTMRADFGNQLLIRNVTANVLRSFRRDPLIDRRGRLAGNMLAIVDGLRGRINPKRILEM